MKKRIFIQQWLELKPYETQKKTDSYYIKLANDVNLILINPDYYRELRRYVDDYEIDMLSCFLVSYFEDIVSETNIWKSFVSYHSKLYNKKLPFYDTKEYYENENNYQDIALLIWYFLNTIHEENFIFPYSDFLKIIALEINLIFDENYEYAPENEHLKSFYNIDKTEKDFYKVRSIIDNLLFNSYLFYPDTHLKFHLKSLELLNNKSEHINMILNDLKDASIHSNHTCLLSLKGKEWVAEILGTDHPLSNDLLNMSQKIAGYFFYKGQDEKYIFIEHIASGKKFDMLKSSYESHKNFKIIDTIIYIGIVKWQNEWWFSGICVQSDYNADLVLNEKNSLESRMAVNFLDLQKEDIYSRLNNHMKAFLSFNNNSQIAFLPTNKILDFNKKVIENFNNSLNLSNKERDDAKNRVKEDGFLHQNKEIEFDLSKMADSGLFFFNPKSGGEMVFGVNSAFPAKNNPFFNAEDSEEEIFHLLMSNEMSTELVMYCIDNYKNKLPFFKSRIGKQYLEDIDFLLRFWKKESYHSKPEMTLV
jgi:hypothetical protein